MKKFVCLLFLLPLFAFDSGDKFLDKIELYQKGSYFKKQVYADKDWKSFYEMLDINQVVNPDNYDLHLMGAAVFFATNKLRESKHLKTLAFSPELRDAAVVETQQMIDKNFFSHFNNRTPKLHSPEDRIKMFGVKSSAMGENIDLTNIEMPSKVTYIQLAEKIVKAFYDSPEHRKIMLGKIYTHIGCSAIFENLDKQEHRYIKTTQDFSADY